MVFSVQLLLFLFIRNEELVTTRLKKEKNRQHSRDKKGNSFDMGLSFDYLICN